VKSNRKPQASGTLDRQATEQAERNDVENIDVISYASLLASVPA